MNSIAGQDYPNIEHIIIDGNSTDGTVELLETSEFDISCLISESDKGIYDAMNKGLGLSRGDIVGFLNSDDIYADPSILSTVAKIFENDKIDAVFGDLQYFRGQDLHKTIRTYRSNKFTSESLSKGLMPAHPTLYLRRGVYEKYGFFNPTYKLAGDFEFIARIFKGNKLNFFYLPKVMVRMQLGGASTAGLMASLRLLQENLRACRENGISSNYLKLISRYPQKILEYFFH